MEEDDLSIWQQELKLLSFYRKGLIAGSTKTKELINLLISHTNGQIIKCEKQIVKLKGNK